MLPRVMRAVRSESAGEPFRFRHSETLLRSVLEHAAVATFLVGADGRLLYANKAFYDLLGYDQNEPVNTEIGALVHPDDAHEAQEQLRALLGGETDHYSGERRYLTK